MMECYVGGVVEPTRLRGVNPVIIPGSVQPRPHIVNTSQVSHCQRPSCTLSTQFRKDTHYLHPLT